MLIATAKRLFAERGVDVPLDEIARTANVANATLYRHFRTRAELIVAVYAEEVDELRRTSERLLQAPDPSQALADWLRMFVRHVATKRELALTLPDGDERGALFTEWQATMHDAATRLANRARDAGALRADIAASDLLALGNGIALTARSTTGLERLLDLLRDGYRVTGASRRD
ncbi:MAG: TetR/AcrR family transcriptional regulator [Solirubrobacterales bacterium]|nr:TetR/AcrR family transcriptional regulator [Solirubrobacterales bacterium]